MNNLLNKKIILSIILVVLSTIFIFIGYKKNENKNTFDNVTGPIVAYIDGVQVTNFPDSCNFKAEILGYIDDSKVSLENESINCNVSTNKWKITYTGFVNKLIIYFSSIDTRKITFHLSSGEYFNGIQQNSNGEYEVRNIVNYTEFRNLMNQYSNYKRAFKAKNNFKGWSTVANSSTVEYTISSSTPILSDLNLYAVWESDTIGPTCSISVESVLVPSVSDAISGVKSQGWTTGDNSISVGNHIYTATDYAENSTSCGVEVNDIIKTEKSCRYCSVYDKVNTSFCIKYGYYDCSTYACASGYTRYGSSYYCYKYI